MLKKVFLAFIATIFLTTGVIEMSTAAQAKHGGHGHCHWKKGKHGHGHRVCGS
jgi:hypothetical protein